MACRSYPSAPASRSPPGPTLHWDDQRGGEREERESFLHPLLLHPSTRVGFFFFGSFVFIFFNLIPHSVAPPHPLPPLLCHLLSTNLLFLYLCERGPEHILISRFHISGSPAAPSLVVQPSLAARRAAVPGCARRAHTWPRLHVRRRHVRVCALVQLRMCAPLLSSRVPASPPLSPSLSLCLVLLPPAGRAAQLPSFDQSHVGHQHSSGTSEDELISGFVSVSSAPSPSLAL